MFGSLLRAACRRRGTTMPMPILMLLASFPLTLQTELDCDFEGPCEWEWTTGPDGFHVVAPHNATEVPYADEDTIPTEDASGNSAGHFLYHSTSPERKGLLHQIELTSPLIDTSSEMHCSVEFSLYMNRMDSVELKILVKATELVWVVYDFKGNNANRWEKYKKVIGRVHEPFRIALEVVPGNAFPAQLAIDNIRVENCSPKSHWTTQCEPFHFKCSNEICIMRDRVCDLVRDCVDGEDEEHDCDKIPEEARCDFENGTCGWTNSTKDHSEWIRHSGATASESEPKTDHTYQNESGHYMFPDFRKRRAKFGHQANINSKTFELIPLYHGSPFSSYFNTCQVRFYYHLNGKSSGSLVLNLIELVPYSQKNNPHELWSSPRFPAKYPEWRRVVVSLPTNVTHRYYLQFSASSGYRRSHIAIDDVSLSPECFGIGVPENETIIPTTPGGGETPLVKTTAPTANVSIRYTFGTCNSRGLKGPTPSQCKNSYQNTITSVTVMEEEKIAGVQMWTVPKTGIYTLFAQGASGGQGLRNRDTRSKGAYVRASFNFSEGDKIFILIGQEGLSACTVPNRECLRPSRPFSRHGDKVSQPRGGGGGGGGATYVFKLDPVTHHSVPLVVAAGGGGLSRTADTNEETAIDPNGRNHSSSLPGNGRSATEGAGGGGGWNDSTQSSTSGRSLVEGGQGGMSCDPEWRTNGGFGGGGGGCTSGGGGGGYTGGDVDDQDKANANGQGGTSFVSSSAFLSSIDPGAKDGDGSLDIIPAQKGCGCEYLCILKEIYNNTFECICPGGLKPKPDGFTCKALSGGSSPQEKAMISEYYIALIVIVVIIAICGILYLFVLGFNKYRKKQQGRDLSQEPLSSPELQLSRIRQTPGGHAMVTEYNPNYEFGGTPFNANELPEIPRENLKLVKELGRGAFGEVYQGFLASQPGEQAELPVAVKTLPELSSDQSEVDFLMEALIMSKFCHPNIVRFIGVCFRKHPRFIVLELLAGGDLKSFLRESRPKPNKPSPLTMCDLLNLAIDVAKGCQYLEESRFIHRDIAARNCLLTTKGPGRIVKIADFGMARDIYRADYYKKGGKAMLPVKWMPPEAFLDGVFTSKTDVWSFGVLLWEVMSLGYMPYPGRGNQEVMQLVTSGGRLEAPANCPSPVYHIMRQCWHPVPDERPNFSTILERLGYCLQDPDVINAPLPVFHRPPSMERDVTVMRAPDSDNVCLQVQRPDRELQSPGSEDYLIPMPSSNYSLSTEKTELQSNSSIESVDRLLELDDNPPAPPRRFDGTTAMNPTIIKPNQTWETSFVQDAKLQGPQAMSPGSSDSKNGATSPDQPLVSIGKTRAGGYVKVPSQDESPPPQEQSLAVLGSSLPNSHTSTGNLNESSLVGQNLNESSEKVSSLRSLDALPMAPVLNQGLAPNSNLGANKSSPGEAGNKLGFVPGHRSNLSLDAASLNRQVLNQPLAYVNVDVNSNGKDNSLTRTGSYDQNAANRNTIFDIMTASQPKTNTESELKC